MPQAQTSHSALAAINESSISAKTARDRNAAIVQDGHTSDEQDQKISVDGPKGLGARTCKQAET